MKKLLTTLLISLSLLPAITNAQVLSPNRGGTGISSYTTGDLIYASGASTLSKLNLGGNGTCLGVSGGVLAYVTCGGGGGSPFPTSTNPLMASYFVATSTSATSTFANALSIIAGQTTGSALENTGDGTINVDNTNSNALGLQIYTNNGANTDSPLVLFRSDNTAFDDGVLWLLQDGTAGSAYNLKNQGPAPQIEWVEADQASPAGKYEDGVNGDIRYIASRNSADNSFEDDFQFDRFANGGGFRQLGSGNVGFGTTSPYSKLSVVGQIVASNYISTTTTASTFAGAIGIGATTTPFALLSINATAGGQTNQFVVGSSTDTNFIINNSGFVGIGTTTPNATLAITGKSANLGTLPPNVLLVEGTDNGSTVGQAISLKAGNTASVTIKSGDGSTLIGNAGPLNLFGGTGNGSGAGGDINIVGGSAAGTFATSLGGSITINPGLGNNGVFGSGLNVYKNVNIATVGGLVGIGTTTPNYKLTVASSTAPQLSLSSGAGFSNWTFRNSFGTLYIGSTGTGDATSTLPALMIATNGNVGIATSSPTSLLSVAGTTTASVIQGSASGQGQAFVGTSTGNYVFNGQSVAGQDIFNLASSTSASVFNIDMFGKIVMGMASTSSTATSTIQVQGLLNVNQAATTTCSGPIKGSIFFNSANSHFWGCDGTNWLRLDN